MVDRELRPCMRARGSHSAHEAALFGEGRFVAPQTEKCHRTGGGDTYSIEPDRRWLESPPHSLVSEPWVPRRPAFPRDLLCEVILLVPPQRHNATKLLTCDNTEAGTEPERAGHVAKAVGSFVGSERVAGPLKGQVVVQ